jgi:hypothetical protein
LQSPADSPVSEKSTLFAVYRPKRRRPSRNLKPPTLPGFTRVIPPDAAKKPSSIMHMALPQCSSPSVLSLAGDGRIIRSQGDEGSVDVSESFTLSS